MTVLVTWLWQGVAVAGVAALFVRAFPRLNAATRHAIWWISLVVVILHPWTPSGVPFEPVLGSVRAGEALSETSFFLPMPPHWMVLGGCAAWVCLVAARGWQIVRGVTVVARLKRQSYPLDPAQEPRLPLWRAARGSGRPCELRVSDRCTGACALGFWRPVILLPECLLRGLSDEEIDQVVMHEHAHLSRYDDWSRLFQCGVEAVLGLHPALWFICRRIDLEREAACDDQVVARTGAPKSYAACLARVATILLARQGQQPAFVPAATRSSAMLRSRVTRLLDGQRHRPSHFGWLPTTASAVVLAAVVVGSDQLPPLVTFVADTHVSATPEGTLPSVHPTWSVSLASSMAPLEMSAGTEPPSARRPRAVRTAPVVRRATRSLDEAPAVGAEERPTTVTEMGPLSLDSSALADQPSQVPPEPLALMSEQTSNEPSARISSRLAAVGTDAARAGVAVAGRVRHLGVGVGGWVTVKARAVGKAF